MPGQQSQGNKQGNQGDQGDAGQQEDDQLMGDELYERAKDLDIEGRSEMSADELRRAIKRREKNE